MPPRGRRCHRSDVASAPQRNGSHMAGGDTRGTHADRGTGLGCPRCWGHPCPSGATPVPPGAVSVPPGSVPSSPPGSVPVSPPPPVPPQLFPGIIPGIIKGWEETPGPWAQRSPGATLPRLPRGWETPSAILGAPLSLQVPPHPPVSPRVPPDPPRCLGVPRGPLGRLMIPWDPQPPQPPQCPLAPPSSPYPPPVPADPPCPPLWGGSLGCRGGSEHPAGGAGGAQPRFRALGAAPAPPVPRGPWAAVAGAPSAGAALFRGLRPQGKHPGAGEGGTGPGRAGGDTGGHRARWGWGTRGSPRCPRAGGRTGEARGHQGGENSAVSAHFPCPRCPSPAPPAHMEAIRGWFRSPPGRGTLPEPGDRDGDRDTSSPAAAVLLRPPNLISWG